MSRTRKRFNCHRVLAVFAVMALGMAVFAPPAQAASSIINFDPTGGSGANPNDVLNTSSFAYLPGNVLAVGGGNIAPGSVVPVIYQAILGTINTAAGGNGNTMMGNANTGNITINPAGGGSINTGNQIIIQIQFDEQVQSITTSGTGATAKATVTFIPDLAAGTNSVQLFSQPTTGNASINASSGTGFGPTGGTGATLILSGAVSPTGFVSSFAQNLSSNPTVPGSFQAGGDYALNQHPGGSGSYGGDNGPPGATQSVTGSGSTTLNVNVTSTNSAYFLSSPGPILSLAFPSVSAGLAFGAVDPLTKMFTGVAPNLTPTGAIAGQPVGTAWNGVNTTDFLFQAQGSNTFSVPEPGSIVMVSIGLGLTGLVSLRSARGRKAPSAA